MLSIETFCDLVKRRSSFVLAENFPGADELAVHGPEGRFTHEVVLPLLRVRHDKEPVRTSALAGVDRETAMAGTFAPEKEWLYFKFYGGQGTVCLLYTSEASGIGLVLLGFLYPGEPAWDELLSVDSPVVT